MTGKDSRIRALVLGPLAFAGAVGATQLLPGSAGQKGTPLGILFFGLIFGLLNALIAAGIILIYRTTRIINFAQAAIGAGGGVFTYNLVVSRATDWPYPLAFVAGVIVAAAIGLLVELFFVRRFFNAPRLVLTVVTIALVPALAGAANYIRFLPLFGDADDRELLEVIGAQPLQLPFSSFRFEIGDLPLPFGFAHLFSLGAALLALGAIAFFFRFTRAGVAVRAAAENAERAQLLGVNIKGLSSQVWLLTGALSGVGVILAGTVGGAFTAVGGGSTGQFIAALAAAVIARMRSVSTAVAAALGLEILRQSLQWSYKSPEQLALFDLFLFALILAGLLLQRRELQRGEESEVSTWKAAEEFRPTPKEMLEIAGVRYWRIVIPVVAILIVGLYPWIASTGSINLVAYIALVGIAMLSLVVLTGWAGQVSLGQFALVGFAALVGSSVTSKLGVSFWLTLPAVSVLTAAFAVLVGIPALRIKGLFLAITTYAFAWAVETNLFNEKTFGWLLPREIRRPRLFVFDFEDERSMYYLALIAFLLALAIVATLRRSWPGRILIGLRDNEKNAQAFGVNIVWMRLWAFALAGFLCGFAGVLIAHHQRAVASSNFTAVESLNVFIFAVIGGIGSIGGAVLGAAYFALTRLYGGNQLLTLVIGPFGLLALLYIAPGGLASIAFGLRDAILRLVALRRRMVVPSLFADIDPTELQYQLAPLAEPLPDAGLATVPADRRYRFASLLYRRPLSSKLKRAPDDAAAIQAAAGGKAEELEMPSFTRELMR